MADVERLMWVFWMGVSCGVLQSTLSVWLDEGVIDPVRNSGRPIKLVGMRRSLVVALAVVSSPLGSVLLLPFNVEIAGAYLLGSSITYGALLSPSIARHTEHIPWTYRHGINGQLLYAWMAIGAIVYLLHHRSSLYPSADFVHIYSSLMGGFAGGALVRTVVSLEYQRRIPPRYGFVAKALYKLLGFVVPAVLGVTLYVVSRLLGWEGHLLTAILLSLVFYMLGTFVTNGWLRNPWPDREEEKQGQW